MSTSSVTMRKRLTRLAKTGSPAYAWKAAKRQVIWRWHEAQVAKAAREGRPLLVGPFLGEVGYELLYWIPMVRRILAEHGVDRERVTVLTRGGAGVWYRDFAAQEIDALELVEPDRFLQELVARRRRVVTTKQFYPDRFDSALERMALERVPGAAVVHPLLMYSRLRFLWENLLPPEQAPLLADYRPLAWEKDVALPVEPPADYVAVKLYFGEQFSDDEASRDLARSVLEQLTEQTDVVVLTSGKQLDEHREWVPDGERIHDASTWVTPQDNLSVQTALVARAKAFLCTYGGFSYLGPMLGVPTLAIYTQGVFSPVHLAVLRAAFPGPSYTLANADAAAAVAGFVSRATGVTP